MAILAKEKVLTLDYWKSANQLRVGDYVFDREGKPVRIKLIQEYFPAKCNTVIFNDNLAVSGDGKLGFPVETPKYRKRTHEYKGKKKFRRPLKPMRVETLESHPLIGKYDRLEFSVPTSKPLEFPHQDLPVPPLLFGFWYFNKGKHRTMVEPKGLSEIIRAKFKDHGYKIIDFKKNTRGDRPFQVEPAIHSQILAPNIPTNYLLSSAEQRLEFLSGVIHAKSRQYSVSKDTFRITDYNRSNISQLQQLVESLGMRSKVYYDNHYKYYTLYFRSRLKLIGNQVSPPVKVHQARRFIKSIEKIAPQLCIHIETENKDNTILVGEGFISCL